MKKLFDKRPMRCRLGFHRDEPLDCQIIDGGMYAEHAYFKGKFKCQDCGREVEEWLFESEYHKCRERLRELEERQ